VAPVVGRLVRGSRPRTEALVAAALALLEDEPSGDVGGQARDAPGRSCVRLLMAAVAVPDVLQEWRVGVVMSGLLRTLQASLGEDNGGGGGDSALGGRLQLLLALCKGSSLARAWAAQAGRSGECAWVAVWLAAADEDADEGLAGLRGAWDDLLAGRAAFGRGSQRGRDDDPRWLLGRQVRLASSGREVGAVVAFDASTGHHAVRNADKSVATYDMGRVGWELA
jgi:hypothetical protein